MDDAGLEHAEGGGGEGENRRDVTRRHPLVLFLLRGCFLVAFSLGASFLFSSLFGLLALLIGNFSGPHSPVSVPAQCRVVSSSVDLRSSKVCELALSNYKAKHVLYPSGKSKVRCHDDYYWASVFKVEYKEYFSGRTLRGVAESPKEALPLYCRPSFSTAWLTKSKFKTEDPSMVEMVKRFSILFLRFISSFSWDRVRGWHHILAAAAGIVAGVLSSMSVVAVVKVFRLSRLALSRKPGRPLRHHLMTLAVQFRRVCLLVAYISALGWLTLQYSHFVGLKQLFLDSNSGTAITR